MAALIYPPDGTDVNGRSSQDDLVSMEDLANGAIREGVKMLRTADPMMASKFGVVELPNVVYFSNRVPSLYDGAWLRVDHVHLLQLLIFPLCRRSILGGRHFPMD